MAPLPDAPQVLRVALGYTIAEDSQALTRFYVSTDSSMGNTTAVLNTCASSIATSWNSHLAASHSNSVTLTSVNIEDLTGPTAGTGTATVSHDGTKTGAVLSAGACAIVRFKVDRRYRGGHPRAYLPAFDETDVLDRQSWEASSLATLVTAWGTFMSGVISAVNTAYATTGNTQVNVSYYEGFTNVTYPSGRTYPRPTLRSSPLVDEVVSVSANPKIGSQRRRNLTP